MKIIQKKSGFFLSPETDTEDSALNFLIKALDQVYCKPKVVSQASRLHLGDLDHRKVQQASECRDCH